MTAAELVMKLEADPEFVAARARRDAEFDARDAELRRAEAPLVAELRATGYAVESVWDLVNPSAAYPDALPILLQHLPRPYPAAIREGIARALAVREARFAWDALVAMYREEPDDWVKHGLAVAVAGIAGAEQLEQVIALASDPQHGTSRGLLLSRLQRSRDPRAHAALRSLAEDPDLREEIAVIHRRRTRKYH